MIIKLNKTTIKVKLATSFKTRFIGLMGQKNISYGLLIPNCRAIHTFFMRANIDLVGLNQANQIIALKRNLKPWRLYQIKNAGKTNILELPANSTNNLKINDFLFFEQKDKI